jgi:hypothetical protein
VAGAVGADTLPDPAALTGAEGADGWPPGWMELGTDGAETLPAPAAFTGAVGADGMPPG